MGLLNSSLMVESTDVVNPFASQDGEDADACCSDDLHICSCDGELEDLPSGSSCGTQDLKVDETAVKETNHTPLMEDHVNDHRIQMIQLPLFT